MGMLPQSKCPACGGSGKKMARASGPAGPAPKPGPTSKPGPAGPD